MSDEDLWNNLKNQFLKQSGVKKQGESLKINKKMFAQFSKGNFIIKLPKERVTELKDQGIGQDYDPGNGKIMKEWVIIPKEYGHSWIELTEEAKKFAFSLSK